MMRDMTKDDEDRLALHPLSRRLLHGLTKGAPDGMARQVATLETNEWRHLRPLLELGFVDVEDGRCIVAFTVSSLVRMGYVK
jgi:hypothetical protein